MTIEDYPDGRIKIERASGTKVLRLRNLTGIPGYKSSNNLVYTPHVSDYLVNINEGLKDITVSCNLVNREYNIEPDGKRSTIITTLPIDGTQPLLGTVTKYTDIESQVRADVGKYN